MRASRKAPRELSELQTSIIDESVEHLAATATAHRESCDQCKWVSSWLEWTGVTAADVLEYLARRND